ncbi:MAG: hypothetical protein ACOY3P_19280, partial [Planctomycetota bacterium]
MTLNRLLVLLPCRSIEELSLDRPDTEAEQLLGAFSILFHPALLAEAGDVPSWESAEAPPGNVGEALVIVPPCSEHLLPTDWVETAEAEGARIVRHAATRSELLARALDSVNGPAADAELTADMFALGLCYFMVELMTRQLRYMSNLDEAGFRDAAVKAARAARDDDEPAAKQHLEKAFTLLYQSREYYYPVESNLVDLTLVAESTLGPELAAAIDHAFSPNLLVSGEVIERLAERDPTLLATLRKAIEAKEASFLGGEVREAPWLLMPPEAIRDGLQRGLAVYEEHLGTRPAVFGRRRFGLTPILPQILGGLGFVGAIHSTLDDGRFPTGNQSRIRWEGSDGTAIEAIARVPLDAGRTHVFLALPERLGSALDLDHVSTVVFAHWPGAASIWYDDLHRIARYTSVIGSFVTVNRYFDDTSVYGQTAKYRADEYQSPYLQQAVDVAQTDPISRWVRYHARRAQAEAARALHVLLAACGGAAGSKSVSPAMPDLLARADDLVDASDDADAELDQALAAQVNSLAAALAAALCGRTGEASEGQLWLSPSTAAQTRLADVSAFIRPPAVQEPVQHAGESGRNKHTVVDVPGMGFAWIGPAMSEPPGEPARRGFFARKPATPPMVEENRMRNEFFEVVMDPSTGAIRAVLDDHSRGPRIAQQIALRSPEGDADDPGHESHYTIMAADQTRFTCIGPVMAEALTRGRLMGRDGKKVATFEQRTRLWRGSRIIEVEVEIEPIRQPEGNPWGSYYGLRFAWGDETAELYRGANMLSVPTSLNRIESPHFVEIRLPKSRVTVLTGGLPYHRRYGFRKLDTLLIVPGERARRCGFGIGIDLP